MCCLNTYLAAARDDYFAFYWCSVCQHIDCCNHFIIVSEARDRRSYRCCSGCQYDCITLEFDMPVRIVEANPLVEESRGQVAVVRGPIVYCAESQDLGDTDIDDIVIPVDAQFHPVETTIAGSRIMALEGEVLVRDEQCWTGHLYRDASTKKQKKTIRLIPYYAWGNRGKSEMTVWMPAGY